MICPNFPDPQFLVFSSTIPSLVYFSHIPAMIFSLILGFFIFIKSKKSPVGKILFSISIAFFLWTFLSLILWASNDSTINIFLWSFFGIIYPLIYILSAYLVYFFIEKKDVSLKTKIVFSLSLLPVLILTPTRFNMERFNITGCGADEGKYFTTYYYSLGFLVFLFLIFLIIKKYRVAEKIYKKQILLLGLGIGFFLFSFFVTGTLASLLVQLKLSPDFGLEQYGLFGMIVFLAFLSYLILKYQAFDVKAIAGQFLTVTVWVAVFSQLFMVQSAFNLVVSLVMLILTTIFGFILFRSVKEEVLAGERLHEESVRLSRINEKLKELDRAKTEFISIASHQLRTPLTSIKGFSSLILENAFGKIPKKQKEAVNKIFVNNEKLVLLVEDMLNVSRLESGRLQYDFEETDVVPLVKEAIKNLKLYAKNKKLYLKFFKSKKELPLVLADQRKTTEIVSNLIDNAIKYTHKGGVEVFVEGFERDQKVGKFEGTGTFHQNWVRIKVKDTGIGLGETEKSSIFEKFKRGTFSETESNGNLVSGTGLGVYISRQMAHAMGGHLYAESDGPKKGSTFILELPGITKNGNK